MSDDDIKVAEEVSRNPSSLILNTWSKDPTKLAVLQALVSCQAHNRGYIDANIVDALAQKSVGFLHSYLLEAEEVH